MMECVNCEINLLKRDVKMNDYSKASVEVLNHFPELSAMCFCHMLQCGQRICWQRLDYRKSDTFCNLSLCLKAVNPENPLHLLFLL